MSSLAALIGFLLLSAPGLVYEAIRERRRPALDQTALREAGRVTLASFVFTSASAGLLAIAWSASPAGKFPSPTRWVTSTAYQQAHWLLAARTVIIGVVLACGLAAGAARLIYRGAAQMSPMPRIWEALNDPRFKDMKLEIYAEVRATTGEVYAGLLSGIDHTGDPATRVLSLDQPLTRSGVRIDGPHRLILGLSQAEVIAVTFRQAGGR